MSVGWTSVGWTSGGSFEVAMEIGSWLNLPAKIFPDQSRLWDALVEITSEGHLPLADPSSPVRAEDEDPFADFEDDLAETLEAFFECDEDQGPLRVGRTGVWPDCFEAMIAKDYFSKEVVTLMRSFLAKSIPGASVYITLEDPDCNAGDAVGYLAVFADQIWATQNILDFLALRLASS